MVYSSPGQQQPRAPAISQPITYYTEDSLNFNNRRKNLYGEIYSDEPLVEEKQSIGYTMESSQQASQATLWIYAPIALLSAASLALYASVIPLWERNFEHTRLPLKGDWTDGLMILPLSISFIVATAIFVCGILQRRAKSSRSSSSLSEHRVYAIKSYHQSKTSNYIRSSSHQFYKILLSSTLILALIPLLVLSTTNSLARAFRPSIRTPSLATANIPTSTNSTTQSTSQSQLCTKANIMTKPCMPILYQIGDIQIAAAVTAGATTLLWIGILLISIHKLIKIRKQDNQDRHTRHVERKQKHRERRHKRSKKQPPSPYDDNDRKEDYDFEKEIREDNQSDLIDNYYYSNTNIKTNTNNNPNPTSFPTQQEQTDQAISQRYENYVPKTVPVYPHGTQSFRHQYNNNNTTTTELPERGEEDITSRAVGMVLMSPPQVAAAAVKDTATQMATYRLQNTLKNADAARRNVLASSRGQHERYYSVRASEQIVGLQQPPEVFRPAMDPATTNYS